MNLERMEEKCIEYLEQTSNPIVPLDNLLRFLWRDDEFTEVTRAELLSFLRKHELVDVVDADADEDTERAAEYADAGIAPGPRVILKSRMPSKAEMSELINAQLGTMTDALRKAFQEAARQGDNEACTKIRDVLERTEALREQLAKVL
jgi:hypothetical protein